MPYCKNCGAQLEENTRFCPNCGTQITADTNGQTQGREDSPFGQQSANQSSFQDTVTEKFNQFNNTSDTTAEFDPSDIAANKIMGVLSYFSWLVLIPIFAAKDSKFARFHANQGLVLAIAEVLWGVCHYFIRRILWRITGIHIFGFYSLITAVLGLVNVVFLAFAIIGIINVANGKAKELPLIGNFKILS